MIEQNFYINGLRFSAERAAKLVSMSSEEFDRHMVDSYPELFVDLGGDRKRTCMYFGCCIPEGWRPALDATCRALEQVAESANLKIKWLQIKQKFSSACFYYSLEEGRSEWAEVVGVIVRAGEGACNRLDEETGKLKQWNS